MSLTLRAVSGAGWSTLANVLRQILTFAGVAVLARQLGPGAYGLMAIAAIVLGMLTNFRDLGTASAIIQRPSISPALLSSLFWVNLSFGTILTLTIVATSVPVAWFFETPEVAPVLRWLSISFLLQSAGAVHNALLNREMRFKITAVADVASALGGYIVAIPMAIYGYGVWSLVAANLVSPLAATLIYWLAAGWTPSFTFHASEIRQVASFSLNLSGFGLVNYFARNADNIVVGRFLGAGPLGNYQMAYNLMMYPIQNISMTLSQALLPAFAKIQDDNARLSEAYLRSCSLLSAVTFPVIAGMAIVAQPFVAAILGPKWIAVIPIFQILAPVGMLQSVHTTAGLLYVAKGQTATMLKMGIFGTAIYVVAFIIGAQYQTTGVATAYCLAYFLVVMYPTLAVPLKLVDLTAGRFAREIWPQLLTTGAMGLACIGFQRLHWVAAATAWVQLLTTVTVGALVYVAILWWFRPPVVRYAANICLELKLPGHHHLASWLQRLAAKP